MDPTPLQAFMTSIGDVVTAIVGWVGSAATTIVNTPLLLFSVGFFAIGGAIGILGRLLRRS